MATISNLSGLQAQYGGQTPISLSEYYHNGDYVQDNNVPTSGTLSFSMFTGNQGPQLNCTSNYALNHTCIHPDSGFHINLNLVDAWLPNTVALYEESFSNAYKYRYDGGWPIPNHINDGANDMFDSGNYITIVSDCIGGVSNEPYVGIPYGNLLGTPTHGVLVASACNWPHLSMIYVQNDRAGIAAYGNTGSDGNGAVSNLAVQEYSTSNARYGSIWTCFNGLAGDPSIIDVWFTIQNSNWNSVTWEYNDQRKTDDTNDYNHLVGVAGSNFILAKALVSLSNGELPDAETMTSFIQKLVYNMPLQTATSNVIINRTNDVCNLYGGDD